MKWGAPELLVWLWLLAPAAWLLLRLVRLRERRLARLFETAAWPAMAGGWLPGRARTRAWLWLAAAGFLLLALARPQWGFHWQEVRRRGLDLMFVLDTSRSMTAQDLKPNRLQQAKWAIRDLVQTLRGDRAGLVAFAGSSFLQCPLTLDYAAFLMTLDDVYSGIIPRGGTAIEQALRKALDSFEEKVQSDRVILLITDGDDHEGDPRSLIPELKKRGIRVFAVGIGSLEGDLLPSPEPGGGYFKDRSGKMVKSALHEDVLEALAVGTGGAYVRAVPGENSLETAFTQVLSGLKRAEGESKMIRAYEDRFAWPVGLALLLLAVEAAMPERRREGRP